MKKLMSYESNGNVVEVWAHRLRFPKVQRWTDGSCSIYADGMQEDFSVDAGDQQDCYSASFDAALYLNGEFHKYYGEVRNLHVCKDLQILRHIMKTSVIKWRINVSEDFRMEPVGIG